MPARLAAAETLPRASPRKRVMASCSNRATARSLASWKRSPLCMVAGSASRRPRSVRHLDIPARREHHGSFDDVLQLTEIAGPGIALEEIERLGSEAVDLLVHLRLGFAQEVMREDG